MLYLDHIMYAVPDLEDSMAEIASITGIVPSNGGVHPGNGTRNALLGLSDSSYLEIIGPDKKQNLENTLGELLVSKNTSGIRAWAVAVSDLALVADVAQDLGFRVRERKEMSRKTPEGSLLEWELLFLDGGPLLPFFIDWKGSEHPARKAPSGCGLSELSISAEEPKVYQELLNKLQLEVSISEGEPAISAIIRSPKGDWSLPSW